MGFEFLDEASVDLNDGILVLISLQHQLGRHLGLGGGVGIVNLNQVKLEKKRKQFKTKTPNGQII